MTKSFIANVGVLAAVAAIACLTAAVPVGAQTARQKPASPKPVSSKPGSAIGRTPDGQPSMRGVWFNVGGGLNEAGAPRAQYTDDCRAAFGGKAEPTGFSNTEPKAKPQHLPEPRPQGVVDPPDRVLPWRPDAAAARAAYIEKMVSPPSLQYVEKTARCTPPGPWPIAGSGGGNLQILQGPGTVTLLYEYDHASRTIHLDGRPHLPPGMRLFMGDSIGHWEGNTLIVDTTNFNGIGSWGRLLQYFTPAMHLTERFTVVAADRIDYELVYDDPGLFTRPIKSVGYYYPADDGFEMMEETCNEGSHTLRNIFGF